MKIKRILIPTDFSETAQLAVAHGAYMAHLFNAKIFLLHAPMNTLADTINIVEKELLETMHFPQQEVLSDIVLIQYRRYEAQRAMKLGNSFKDKVKIVFEDTEGMKMVELRFGE